MLPRTRSLEAFSEPASVAVIGASSSPTKLGYAVLKSLVENGYGQRGRVYPINPKSEGALVVLVLLTYCPRWRKRTGDSV
jgi:acyl-CoA synthetase (NDP forming)